MEFESLQKLMRDNGIVGCGGAGFPSYAKLNKNADTIVINCAECEPLLRLHRQLIEKQPVEVMQTAQMIAETIGAKQVIIGIKAAYVNAVTALKANIAKFPLVKLCLLEEVYPAGDELILINETTGRVVQPGKLPISVGVIVYNVETIYNVYKALEGKPVTHKYVTITGDVKSPQTFYAPIGSLIWGLIKRCGGSSIEDPAFLIGGPMMGYVGSDKEVVTKTTNAVIVLPKDHPVILRKRTKIGIDYKRAMAACCQCNYCTDMCPRHMLGHPIDPAKFMRSVSNQDHYNVTPYMDIKYCSQCGVCEAYACEQGLSPKALIQAVRNRFKAAGMTYPEYEGVAVPLEDRKLRRVPLPRLVNRLALTKYNHTAPIYVDPINAKEVDIKLNQHIGVPAKAIVKVGDLVKEGDIIASAADSSLSVNIHASINGTVIEVTDGMIKIRK